MGLNKALFSSERGDWQTPDHIVEAVKALYGGVIDLDPCTSPDNPVGATRFFTKDHDGLTREWPVGSRVYINPPYGRAIGAWVDKALDHSGQVVMLLPARTDTKWFQKIYDNRLASYGFLRGRLTFKGAPGPAPFPSVLVYWSDLLPTVAARKHEDFSYVLDGKAVML